jgi:protein gp37
MPARGFNWWWDATSNPVGGCFYVTPGCTNCFAPAWHASHTHPGDTEAVEHGVITKVNGRWIFNGKLTSLPDGHHSLTWILRWPGAEHPKLGPGKPSLVFVADMSDLFHEGRSNEIIDRVCGTTALSKHIGLLLTKRTGRMAHYFTSLDPRTVRRWQPQNWTGFSAENQECFDLRWADMRLLAEAGWFVFVSIAPMLGPVILPRDFLALGKRTWVIVAGEQRVPGTRPRYLNPQWARAIRDQCREAGVPFFMKQMSNGAARPPDLQIRQFPSVLAH